MSASPQALEASEKTPGAVKIYAVVLSVGIACALAIVSVYEVTKPIIRNNQIEFRQAAVLEVLEGADTSQAFRLNDSGEIEAVSGDTQGSDLVFAGYDPDGELVGVALETQGMGYADTIQLLYGYSFDKQAVVGTKVLKSLETPGLGDRIEKDADFLKNFEQLDVRLANDGSELAHPIEFVKPGEKSEPWQIDGITGATISSRAVAEMLSSSTAEQIPRIYPQRAEFAQADKEAG